MSAGREASSVGVVVIGRNEGERLVRCLESARTAAGPVVYVDSDSDDGSPERALELGAELVRLDMDQPFTAARARNEGLQRLIELAPTLSAVQFVDGDCELQSGWLETALAELDAHDDVAVVCGRRRERFPDASPYNRLADLEWDTPIGEALACGGDALFRVDALRAVDGYDASLIAGEEPELCLRLRRRGFRVLRIDAEMTLHDADMHRFGQWWKRHARAGHAYAESAWLHGASPDRYCVRDVASILVWGAAFPLVAVALAPATFGVSIAVAFAVLALQVWRIARGHGGPHAWLWAASCVLAKFPQCQGVLTFGWNRGVRRRRTALIEYKHGQGDLEGRNRAGC